MNREGCGLSLIYMKLTIKYKENMLVNLSSLRIDYNRSSNFPNAGWSYLPLNRNIHLNKRLGGRERRRSNGREEGQRKEERKTRYLKNAEGIK